MICAIESCKQDMHTAILVSSLLLWLVLCFFFVPFPLFASGMLKNAGVRVPESREWRDHTIDVV